MNAVIRSRKAVRRNRSDENYSELGIPIRLDEKTLR